MPFLRIKEMIVNTDQIEHIRLVGLQAELHFGGSWDVITLTFPNAKSQADFFKRIGVEAFDAQASPAKRGSALK